MLDFLIRGARIVDGTGNPWYRADVGVQGGRIAAVGDLREEPATQAIEVDGLVLAPGFIDMHAHSDLQLLLHPAHEAKVHQGVTLDVIGQDGLSYAPVTDAILPQLQVQLAGWNGNPAGFDWDWRSVDEYLERFDRTGVAINVAYLVPHGTLRMRCVGFDDRPATPAELEAMKHLLAEGLAAGAVGLSTGLTYSPAMFASDEELVELCTVMTGSGAYYCPHHRGYGATALEQYAASIEIARQAQVPIHLAHAHLAFPVNRDRGRELLALVDESRRAGIDVTLDVYPYTAGSTYLHALLPGWMHEGGPAATLRRLRRPELRERLRVEIEEHGSDGYYGIPVDWGTVVVDGVDVAASAAKTGKRPIDQYCDLVLAGELRASVILHNGNEHNVRLTMAHTACCGGSDAILVGDRPHPRGWGSFPRYLAQHVRELGLVPLEQMIRKLTSLPAQRLGLADRGVIRPGMAADLVCFDEQRVRDIATFESPKQLAEGIPHVFVNGRPVVADGRHTGDLPGQALRRRSFVRCRSKSR